MSEPLQSEVRAAAGPDRSAEERSVDHASIGRLADELLPALIAKLGASGLGELEVREGSWRVRLRRPVDGAAARERRSGTGAGRTQPGHAGHGHGPVPPEGGRSSRLAAASTNGASEPALSAIGPGQDGPAGDGLVRDDRRSVATSPAVGTYQPRTDIPTGTRIRAGDRLGVVDMLGIPQEVVAPVDGILGVGLVGAGDAVEYGQELVVIEFPASPAGDG